jgi:hypothetical protein
MIRIWGEALPSAGAQPFAPKALVNLPGYQFKAGQPVGNTGVRSQE